MFTKCIDIGIANAVSGGSARAEKLAAGEIIGI
jgi:hypothetical protein